MKIGIVLEGGAMRGMYTSGVLDVLMDLDIPVDKIIGVSAGVLFGVNYASKQKGRALRYNKKYIKNKKYMGLYSLLTTGNIVNKKFAFYEVPMKLDLFDDEAFKKSNIEFYGTVTNVKTGEPEYLRINSVLEEMEILRASSALPFVSHKVKWKGKKYLDGGIADGLPVRKMKEMGCDKVILILTRDINYRKQPVGILFKIFNRLFYPFNSRLVKAINDRNPKYNAKVEDIIQMEKNGEIFVIRPSEPINIGRLEKDIDKLQEVYDLGISDAKKNIEALKKYIEK